MARLRFNLTSSIPFLLGEGTKTTVRWFLFCSSCILWLISLPATATTQSYDPSLELYIDSILPAQFPSFWEKGQKPQCVGFYSVVVVFCS